jgi:hypothetical protein
MTSIFTFSVPSVTNMDRLLDEESSNPGGEEFFCHKVQAVCSTHCNILYFKPLMSKRFIYLIVLAVDE